MHREMLTFVRSRRIGARAVSACVLGIFVGLLVLTVPASLEGQKKKRRDLKEVKRNYDQLLKKEFMEKVDWQTSFRKALALAKEKQVPVLIYFTRSDKPWPPSLDQENKNFLSQWWIDAGERFIPYINVHTGGLKLREETLSTRYFATGMTAAGTSLVTSLPQFVFVDQRGLEINRFIMRDQVVLEEMLGEVEELLDARRAVKEDRGNKPAKARLTLLEGMRLSKPNMNQLAKAARTKGLDSDILDRYKQFRAAQPIKKILAERRAALHKEVAAENYQAVRLTFADRVYKLYLRGLRIDDRSSEVHQDFWEMTFWGAIDAKNMTVAIKGLEVYERSYGHESQGKRDVKKMKEALEGM